MRNILCLILILSSNVYCQSVYRILKPKSLQQINIKRITIVDKAKIESTIRAITYQSALRRQLNASQQNIFDVNNNEMIFIEQTIEQTICDPTQIYGGYNYLRLCSQNMKSDKQWKNINKSNSFNGVHHIINTSTLKELYKIALSNYNSKIITNFPFFEEFIKNTPAIFHELHNDKETTLLFHNKDLQLKIYNENGIKGILDNFFETIDTLNYHKNLQLIESNVIVGTYLEAKLWSDYYGLKWE